jgi:protein SCO1/2
VTGRFVPAAVLLAGVCLACPTFASRAATDDGQPNLLEKAAQAESQEAVAHEYFSDLPLLTHDGREVRFYTDLLKDHVVLIQSFYTHSQWTTPQQNQVLMRLQEMLGERLGRDVFMISITVDPGRDTVEALRDYAAKLEPRPGWVFLTGKKENVDWVNHRLGQYVEDLEEHKGVYMLGNVRTTLWMKVPMHGQPLDLYRAIQTLLDDPGEVAANR